MNTFTHFCLTTKLLRMESDINVLCLTIMCFSLLHVCQSSFALTTSIETSAENNKVTVDQTQRSSTYNITCVFDWEDGELTENHLTPNDTGLFTRTYNGAGFFNVKTVCLTEETYKQSNHVVYSGETITQLSSSKYYVSPPIKSDLMLKVTFQTGTDATINITLMHTEYLKVLDNVNSGSHDIMLPKDKITSPGVYTIQVIASNRLTPPISAYSLVFYMDPVSLISIATAPISVAQLDDISVVTDVPFSIVTAFQSNDVSQTVQIYRYTGSALLFYDIMGYFCSSGTNLTFTYNFSEFGDYVLKLQAFTIAGVYTHPDMRVTAIHIPHVIIYIRNVKAFIDVSVSVFFSVDYHVDLSDASIMCNIDFGAYYTRIKTIWLSDITNFGYYYKTPGLYNVTVECFHVNVAKYINYIDQQIMHLNKMVLRENKVENLVILHDAPDTSHHPFSLTVTVSIGASGKPLNNLVCRIAKRFGVHSDGDTVTVKGDINGHSTLNVTLPRFQNAARYLVTANCSNQLSWQLLPGDGNPVSMYFTVYYDCWLSEFFDDVYRSPTSPRMSVVNEHYQIVADVRLKELSPCNGHLELKWSVYDNQSELLPVRSYNASTFSITPYTLPSGLYKFELTTTLVGIQPPVNLTDHTYVMITDPDLHVVITDGLVTSPVRKALRTDTIVLDSGASYDPAENPDAVRAITSSLTKSWSCFKFPPDTTEAEMVVYSMMDSFFATKSKCSANILPDNCNEDVHYLAPNSLEAGTWYLFAVTLRSDTREKSARQAILAYDMMTLTLQIECVTNCQKGATARGKLRHDNLELNVKILDNIVVTTATYLWTFERFNPVTQVFDDKSDWILGSKKKTGLKVPGWRLEGDEGSKYQASVNVALEDNEQYAETVSYMHFVSNMPPYNGSCHIEGNPQLVSAGIEDVCLSCRHWLDEGRREGRGPGSDDGNALVYEVVQRFLDYDNTLDNLYRDNPLESSSNLRRCVRLSLPEEDVDYTMIEVRVKDFLETPYALQQFVIRIKSPVIGGEQNSQVGEMVQQNSQRLNQAIQIGDTTTLFTTINALSSLRDAGQVEVPEKSVDVVRGFKADGTKVSVSEAMEFIQYPEVGEAILAARNTKHMLLVSLIKGRGILTEEANTDPATQTALVAAASGIVRGSEDALDNTILEEVGKTMEEVIDRFDQIALKNSDSVQFRGFAEDHSELLGYLRRIYHLSRARRKEPRSYELVNGVGSLSDAIVIDDATSYLGITNEADARHLTEYLTNVDPDAQKNQDDSLLSQDETNYFLLKQQQGIALHLKNRTKLRSEQSDRIEKLLGQITHYYPVSDGAVKYIGDPDTSPSVLTLTRVRSDEVGTTTLHGVQTTVKSAEVYTLDKKVGIGIYEGIPVVSTNSDPTVTSHITSKEVYLNIDMDGNSFDGETEIQFQVGAASYALRELIFEEGDADILHREKVYVRNPVDMLCLVVKPVTENVNKYRIWISCSGDVSKLEYDAVDDVSEGNDWTKCFQPTEMALSSPGACSYGIESKPDEEESSTNNRWRRSAVNESDDAYPVINITAATMAFLLWDDDSQSWRSDLCKARWIADEGTLIARCPPQKTMTFANSFHVPPNKADLQAAFLRFSPRSQAAVLAALIFTFLLYVLAVIWARHVDKEDILKWGITPLADNFAEDNYFYIIRVFTGLRPGAGTRSKVGFVLGGDEIDTGLRKLTDGVRKEFTIGSVMNYLMAAPSYLGNLEYIRVWHDNSGQGRSASWYLSKIEIQDVQRNESFSFLAERWLALDQCDGQLECVVPLCKVDTQNMFKHRFAVNAKETLADSHIWISILYRPIMSHFTRVQRISCAFVFLMLTMISNALFYNGEANYITPDLANIGPFHFTMQQVYISLVCALITTPVTLLLIYLFKLSKPRPPTNTPFSKRFERASRYRIPFTETWLARKYRESLKLEQSILTNATPKYEGFSLPPWCVFVAWTLVAITGLLSSFFVLLLSMEWGKQKSEEWLTTFFLCFFESVFCLDPIKVAVTAVLLTMLLRKSQGIGFLIDRQTIMKKYKSYQRGMSGGLRQPAPPLDEVKLAEARALKERDMRMARAVNDIIINVIIIWITYSISYSTRDRWSYNMHSEIVDSLLHPRYTANRLTPNRTTFYNINTTSGYFDWLNRTVILNMFPEYDVSEQRLHWRMRQFMQDGAKLRVGPPRLRQLRTTKRKCNIPSMGETHCYGAYAESTEDNGDYCIGWKDAPCPPEEKVYTHSSAAWRFTSAFDILGFPIPGTHTTYGGGGYIVKLSVNREVSQLILQELYDNTWIDSQTRAVLFEFTLYCLNTNIFTYNIFMAEFLETGGVFPYVMILPMRLHMHVGAAGMYTLFSELVCLVYLVIISISTGLAYVKQKAEFFKVPWQVFDLVFICISYVALIMYVIRLVMTNQSLKQFKQDHKEFVNFFHIALWDQLYGIFIAILASMATLRMLNVFGYNKRIGTVANVFINAASELLWFGVFFFYIYTSYAVFGYLLFGSKLSSYKTFYRAMGTLFISMIGKSRFTETDATDPVMSKVYFMLFIFFVVYVILTMFLAVLSKSIDQVHQNIKRTKRDEMVEYVINRFKRFLSLYRRPRAKKSAGGTKLERKRPPPMPWSRIAINKVGTVESGEILKDIRVSLKEALVRDKKFSPETYLTSLK